MADYLSLDTPLFQLGLTPSNIRLFMRETDPRQSAFDWLKFRYPSQPAAVLFYFIQRAFEAYRANTFFAVTPTLRDSIRAIRNGRKVTHG